MMNKQFFGKYRGVVTDNDDPLKIGRVRAHVPDVMGQDESGWALPCMPFAGKNMGFFALPLIGSNVWIEFEQGNPDYPIWTGCWWAEQSELPSIVLEESPKKIALVTAGGHSLLLDDTSAGGITITTSYGQKIVLNQQGIEANANNGNVKITISAGAKITLEPTEISLDNGSGATVKLSAPQVSINNGALEVL